MALQIPRGLASYDLAQIRHTPEATVEILSNYRSLLTVEIVSNRCQRPSNVSRLSCGEAPRACGSSGTPLAAFASDASASGVTPIRLALYQPLQRRARQTARRLLLAAVGLRGRTKPFSYRPPTKIGNIG
jgi:hypothetical protein